MNELKYKFEKEIIGQFDLYQPPSSIVPADKFSKSVPGEKADLTIDRGLSLALRFSYNPQDDSGRISIGAKNFEVRTVAAAYFDLYRIGIDRAAFIKCADHLYEYVLTNIDALDVIENSAIEGEYQAHIIRLSKWLNLRIRKP